MATKKTITLVTLKQFADAVANEYVKDPCRASVTISALAGKYYVAVQRYRERWGEGKVVVCNATAPELEDAIRECAQKWLGVSQSKKALADAVAP